MEEVRVLEKFEMCYWLRNGKKILDASDNKRYVDSEGFLHNINDEPAYICHYKSGDVSAKYWLKHGKDHRLTGPAFIAYQPDGVISIKRYRIYGKDLTKEEWETEVNRIKMLEEIV